jgi:ABC-type transporter Mla subunit MlaD
MEGSTMGHQVFEWVIAIAVLVVFISNLIFLWLFYMKVKPLIEKLQQTSDRINPILDEARGVMGSARGIVDTVTPTITEAQPAIRGIVEKTNQRIDPILGEVQGVLGSAKGIAGTVSSIISDAQPAVRNIATKASDITDMVHGQATQVNTLMNDTVVPTVRGQVQRFDELLKSTTGRVNETTQAIEEKVINSLVTTTNDITAMVRDQAGEIRTLVQETALRVRSQVDQIDDLLRRTTGGIDTSISTLERQVTRPVREVNYVGAAIRKGLSVLFNRSRD